jgi:tRNA-2-methylthio-N6-dimethylallyladenosine synthase
MLLGQNVNSYGGIGGNKGKEGGIGGNKGEKGNAFVALLERLNGIKGLELIRFMTSHPKDASEELFKAIGRLGKVDKRLHLPLQSGSDRILKLMSRGYTRKKYLALVSAYKKYVPTGSITTDIIVGFPSETKKDFGDTLKVIKKCGFEGGFVFKYSSRPPAEASRMKDDVSAAEKERRHMLALEALKRGVKK